MPNYSCWKRPALTSVLLVFADFMQSAGAQAELFFWLTVEGYRVTAQQQLEAMQGWQKDGKKHPSATKGLLKAAALGVYEQYLSDKVGHLSTPHYRFICHNLVRFINKTRPPSGGCTTAQHKSLFLSVIVQASPRVQVDQESVIKLGDKLQKDDPTPEIFDEIQRNVSFLLPVSAKQSSICLDSLLMP